MWGHGAQSAGNEGLTDHSTRDLYGIVAPLPSSSLAVVHDALDAGKDVKSLWSERRAGRFLPGPSEPRKSARNVVSRLLVLRAASSAQPFLLVKNRITLHG